jgi:hypothetical protein
MTKDEALRIALKALKRMESYGNTFAYRKTEQNPHEQVCEALTAIKQALALDKMAENARELGLDYEPAPVQWNPKDHYDDGWRDAMNSIAAQHTEPVGCVADIDRLQRQMFLDLGYSLSDPLYATPPAARRQWVGLTDDERLEVAEIDGADEWFWKVCKAIEAKLKEKNT